MHLYIDTVYLEIPWPIIPEEMSYEAQNLISKLLTLSPEARLGAKGMNEGTNIL